jgi:UDP-3-O-[3-hydroxymyristoyl] N-acetylglucosamine deacetylase
MRRGLTRAIAVEGIGLHSGAACRVVLEPAGAGEGITFLRADLPAPVPIPARAEFAVPSALCTTLAREGQQVGTVEHALAALAGIGVADATLRVWGPELPALDGSAAPWVAAIEAAGLRDLERPGAIRSLCQAFTLRDGPRVARCRPCESLVLEVTIDFPHPLAQNQSMSLDLTPETFTREIAWARTFSLETEVPVLRARGLARGGSLQNALVLAEGGGVLNPEGLRGPMEPLRHKVLDLLGDLALIGTPVLARLVVEQPGHAFNLSLARALIAATEPACPC